MSPIRCAYHPDRDALQYCNRCGKPICNDCVVRGAGGNLCRSCAEGLRRPGRPRPFQTWLWVAAGIALLLLWLLPRVLR
ncbi:MAG: B-box zinc finger protein [Armatimonadota bacterium]|nr:B-box zinc finger protein [Armatimonadota bacterium]MDR5675464.1 B-box zinc finger protein [Armatimonadota bacterium]MDR5688253.1 B-box zinc finger protein [Armatimonadota bacterium]MDR7386199.1 B-box zinc finger protein [Armatimonadota bacterium]MDR7388337.1 B-box zinc finger protein [Armatimonadota bacterium]